MRLRHHFGAHRIGLRLAHELHVVFGHHHVHLVFRHSGHLCFHLIVRHVHLCLHVDTDDLVAGFARDRLHHRTVHAATRREGRRARAQ